MYPQKRLSLKSSGRRVQRGAQGLGPSRCPKGQLKFSNTFFAFSTQEFYTYSIPCSLEKDGENKGVADKAKVHLPLVHVRSSCLPFFTTAFLSQREEGQVEANTNPHLFADMVYTPQTASMIPLMLS
jgi:hypothetical protein